MFGDSKNTILAIVLSALVLICWQYFIGGPQLEKQKQEAAQQQQAQQTAQRMALEEHLAKAVKQGGGPIGAVGVGHG
mgnify:CR=1 FL=1